MPAQPHPAIALLRQTINRQPLRVWSVVISFFGDAIVPRGGSVGMATLSQVCAAFGIEDGNVRTAMSRLASDGWVDRTKQGRNSFYRLTDLAMARSQAATRRIYAPRPRETACGWQVIHLLPDPQMKAEKAALLAMGSGVLAPNVLILPDDTALAASPARLVLKSPPLPEAEARTLVSAAFTLGPLAEAYQRLARDLAAIETALARNPKPDGLDQLALRVGIIHALRRVVLHDPDLPLATLPRPWPGLAARQSASRLWLTCNEGAERWLDDHAQSADGPLPPPVPAARLRFQAAGA